MIRLKKVLYCILILVLALTTTTGCEVEETELAAIELVPQQANIIGGIKLSEILNDTDLIEAYNSAEKDPRDPQTWEDGLDGFVEDVGFDLRDFSEVVIFGDINTFEQDAYLGIILKGTFNKRQFIDRLEDKAELSFSVSDYKGYELYRGKEDEAELAFLSDTMLILGSPEAVKDTIDVRKGDRKRVGGTILDTYNQLGDVLIRFAVEPPEEARNTLQQEIQDDIPISFEYLADIDTVGLSVNIKEETIGVHVMAHFLSVDSAEGTYNTLLGALLLFRGMVQEQPIKELLSKISINITDDSIRIALETSLSEIVEKFVSMVSPQPQEPGPQDGGAPPRE